MLIRRLSEIANLSIHTIRYYEREGLLDDRHVRRLSNGYRDYTVEAVERLLLLRQARSAGFHMREVKRLAKAYDSGRLTAE